MPDYNEMMTVPPFQGGYMAFQYALSMLYGNPTLDGDYLEGGLDKMEFKDSGFIVRPGARDFVFEYENTLLFQFDPNHQVLIPITEIPPGLIDQLPNGQKLCSDCISSELTKHTQMRWLVR